MIVKQPKIWQYFGKIFPGITSKTKEGEIQAVNQWTGKPDYYDDGKPIMYPYVRCKLTDEIINATRNDAEVDHADGDRRNNTIENFTIVTKYANAAKAECTSYEEVEKKLSKIIATIKKFKALWNGIILKEVNMAKKKKKNKKKDKKKKKNKKKRR